MSIKLMTAVWESGLDGVTKAVALAYADFAADDGSSVYPSVPRMAWKTSFSERTIQRQVKLLEEMGVMILVKETDGRPGITNVYRFNADALPARPTYTGDTESPVPMKKAETGDRESPVRVTESHPTGDRESPDPSYNHHKEPSKKVSEVEREREDARETNPLLSLSENTKEIYALLENSGISPRSPRGRDVLARGHPLEYVRAHVEHWQREGKSAAVLIRRLLDDDPLPPRPEERRAAQYVIPPEYVDLIVR